MTPIEALQADLLTVKQHLAIAYVMEHYDHTPEMQSSDGRLHYINPFRQDENPSFDVFSQTIKGRVEPEERWGDFAESTNGDVIDLVQRFENCSRTIALSKARDLLAAQLEDDWDGPTVQMSERQGLNLDDVALLAELGRPLSSSQTWWALTRTHPGLANVVLPSQRVFVHPQHDTLVFLLSDEAGEVQGVRFRDAEGRKYGLTGTRNILMRLGEPRPELPVFLCEGETDTWAAWGALGGDYEVLGVPGVGNHPERTAGTALDGRTVYIAFDPDEAGALGRQQWIDYLSNRGCTLHIVVLSEEKDVAKLHTEQIQGLPSRARHMQPAPTRFLRMGDQYYTVVNKNGDVEERSNWSFEPGSVLVGEGGERAYQGYLLPGRKPVTLPASALSSARALRSWGSPYQARWYGSDAQVQQLAALIDHEAAFLPEGRQTDRVGLYEGTFVLPDSSIGGDKVFYVPSGSSDISLSGKQVFIKDAPCGPPTEIAAALYRLQNPAVTGSIMSWLAAAPLRSRFERFPFLSVSGVSGTGKSTLVEEFLRVFSGVNITTNLTSTTEYGVEGMFNSSNGLPVWFDEYRPGAKVQTLGRINQLLRDAYTGQPSSKGGGDDPSKIKLTRTDAPIIVTGEDNFTETSHVDRSIPIRLRRDEQGDIAALRKLNVEGFAYRYLHFLTTGDPSDPDSQAPVFDTPTLLDVDTGGQRLHPRQYENLQVLNYGWLLLESFLQVYDPGFALPPLDLSRIIEAGVEAGQSDPITELMRVLYENETIVPTVWVRDGYAFVHPANLLRESRNYPSIVLPSGNSEGISKALIEERGGERAQSRPPRIAGPSNAVRVIRVPLDALGWGSDADTESPDEHHPTI